jgi:aldehyde dehydrogenase (NAD+)
MSQFSATASANLACETAEILTALGVASSRYAGGTLPAHSPITGEIIGQVRETSAADASADI